MNAIRFSVLAGAVAGACLLAGPAGADPLMGKNAWAPSQQVSRASIAALMLQREQMLNPPPAARYETYDCGGGGTSTATANSTCIILNKTTASIITNQDNLGDQTSNSESSSTVNGATEGTLSEALEMLSD